MNRSSGGIGRAAKLFIGFVCFGGRLLYGQAASFPPSISDMNAYLIGNTIPGGPDVTAQANQAPNGFTLQILGANFNTSTVIDWINNTTGGTTTNFSGTQITFTGTSEMSITVPPVNHGASRFVQCGSEHHNSRYQARLRSRYRALHGVGSASAHSGDIAERNDGLILFPTAIYGRGHRG
jgi:hypothetical protein